VRTYQRPLVALVALAVALMLVMKILATLRATAPTRSLPPGSPGRALGTGEPALELAGPARTPALAAPAVPAPRVTDPDMTARVVRAWMKDA
jgi:hypothetical protein